METPTAHSKLGASGAHRWMPCPGSVKQSKPLPREEESDYALEGTGAHSLLSDCILKNVEPWTRAGQFIDVTNNLGKVSKWEVTNEMIEAVTIFMADIKNTHPNPTAWGAETAFHRPEIHESFYGTCDFWAVEGTTLYVTDFKYGMGVVVEPEENPQLMYYAIGALLTRMSRILCKSFAWDSSSLVSSLISSMILANSRNSFSSANICEHERVIHGQNRHQSPLARSSESVALFMAGSSTLSHHSNKATVGSDHWRITPPECAALGWMIFTTTLVITRDDVFS